MRIIRYMMAYKWLVLLFLCFAFLSNIGNLLGPRFAGKAIDVAEEGYRLGPGHVDLAGVRHYALLNTVITIVIFFLFQLYSKFRQQSAVSFISFSDYCLSIIYQCISPKQILSMCNVSRIVNIYRLLHCNRPPIPAPTQSH